MKIVIIEDERLTANDLELTIRQYDASIEVTAKLLSVKDAVRYFNDHEAPDLIFSDIQLGDGLSFEIFKATPVNVPVIFCTAYDEYALDAFRANGIDYLLKPFTLATVSEALNKFKRLVQLPRQHDSSQFETILQFFEKKSTGNANAILVPYRDKIIPIRFQDIALFGLENDVVHMLTFDEKTYFPNKSLDDLEKMAGKKFYRANRQYLVNRNAVVDVSNHLGRKLRVNVSISIKEMILVSRDKVSHFLKWLSGE